MPERWIRLFAAEREMPLSARVLNVSATSAARFAASSSLSASLPSALSTPLSTRPDTCPIARERGVLISRAQTSNVDLFV